jgi:hypothetical protein
LVLFKPIGFLERTASRRIRRRAAIPSVGTRCAIFHVTVNKGPGPDRQEYRKNPPKIRDNAANASPRMKLEYHTRSDGSQ